jgi:hypothetical protein
MSLQHLPCLLTLLLCTGICAADARAGAPEPSTETVVARAGGNVLYQGNIDDMIQFADILAGAEMSGADASALRAELIVVFNRDPDRSDALYGYVVPLLKTALGRASPWPQLADIRQGQYVLSLRSPDLLDRIALFGRIVQKYNPVLVQTRDWIIGRTDLESQFHSDDLVATIAGVAPLTQAEKDGYLRELPARFATLSPDEQAQLGEAEPRAASFDYIYHAAIGARNDLIKDIRSHVHSRDDVAQEARRVETECRPKGPYWTSYQKEVGTGGMCPSCISVLMNLRLQQHLREQRSGEHLEIPGPEFRRMPHCTYRNAACSGLADPVTR